MAGVVMASATRWVFGFRDGIDVPSADRRRLLGGKGAGLCEMIAMDLPVPPGFTVTTEVCSHVIATGGEWPEGLSEQFQVALKALEKDTGRELGSASAPLLLSVRSGAAVSMPGMMDTVLNLGLNDSTVESLAKSTGDTRFAYDAYRRFLQMFGDVVLGIHYTRLSKAADAYCNGLGVSEDALSDAQLKGLCAALIEEIEQHEEAFPQDPAVQLRLAVDAVFRSYNSHRARYYRKTTGIADDAGTAVNVQAMVFGNMGGQSGTGVAFTRNPKTGEKGLFGEWLPNAQGEDVVAGIRTPLPIDATSGLPGETLEDAFPDSYQELQRLQGLLEAHYRDMQDIEFTIEQGRLYLLQTRTGKRTASAAVRIVVDFVEEGVITKREAIERVDPTSLEVVMRPTISPGARRKVIAKGLDASPGAACGRVVFQSSDCQLHFERDEPTVLVRLETSPEDIQGMTIAEGVLTARGGQTSHAAVVARGMGKPCVVGCTEIQVDYAREVFYAGDAVVKKGDWITIDGSTGEVLEGQVEMLAPDADSGDMATLLGWADEVSALRVRANADTGHDALKSRQLGAVGIGLCRTEHMFFQPDALRVMRRMILADDPRARQLALNEILPMQRTMFQEIFTAMDGYPVTIRLLDPPLHEFLPQREADITEVANDLGVRAQLLRARLEQLHEVNPMLGHRGVRVGITTPEVYQTQVRAIMEAACTMTGEGVVVMPEIMIPLVGMTSELVRVRALVADMAEAVCAEYGMELSYSIGTMIEIPRAVLVAEDLAKHADFFSFGTNDLTQLTYGFSRDDMAKFFTHYQREGILASSPLATFDTEGVGQLVQMGVERGRGAAPRLKVGVCGEHGGDPTGVGFFHSLGVDYVSCSPYRVPVARLAAAHAALGLL